MLFLQGINLKKAYRNKMVLNDLSFSVPGGSIYGVLGPNGAGKTTLIRILTRLLLPDDGKIIFDNQDLNERHVSLIGYMPEEKGLYKNMKVGEHLLYFSKLRGIKENVAKKNIAEWLKRLEIADSYKKYINELSKGMAQKIQFIATILHDPKLLILDEPFSGLDPISSNLMEREIMKLKSEGATIILSTHRMDQVEHFCDNILLINKGRKKVEGAVKDIKNQFKKNVYSIDFKKSISNLSFDNYVVKSRSDYNLIIESNNTINSNKLLHDLLSNDIEIASFKEILPSMQQIFIEVTSSKDEDEL